MNNTSKVPGVLLAVAAAVGLMWFSHALIPAQPEPAPTPVPVPAPKIDPAPTPVPVPRPAPVRPRRPCPGPGPCPLLFQGGPVAPDGTEVACDLPVQYRMRNIGSRADGKGLCVTTATTVCAEWQGLRAWRGYRDAGPFLDVVLGSGRMACVSWSQGLHWLNCVHIDTKNICIMDNNGDPANLQWMPRAEGLRKIAEGPGAWCGTWLSPGPPPPPRNGVGQLPRRPSTVRPLPIRPLTIPIAGVICQGGVFGPEGYSIGGRSCSLEDVKTAMGDASRPYLTVIGTEAQRKQVLTDMAVQSSTWHLAGYAPDDWAVSLGHVGTGSPTIYAESAAGEVLLRLDSYPGAEKLATLLTSAIRRRQPYDPNKDPDGSAPAVPLPSLAQLPPERVRGGAGALAMAVTAGAVHLVRRKKRGVS